MPDGVDIEADHIRHRQEEEARHVKRKQDERYIHNECFLMTAIVIPEDPFHNNFQKDNVTSKNKDTIRIPIENDKEDDLMHGITLDPQQQPQSPHEQNNGSLQNIPSFQLKPGVVMGRDYVVVGKDVFYS